MKDIKLLISSILIFLAFILGIFVEKSLGNNKMTENEKKEYVNIEIKGNKVKAIKSNDNIEVIINAQNSASGEIILK